MGSVRRKIKTVVQPIITWDRSHFLQFSEEELITLLEDFNSIDQWFYTEPEYIRIHVLGRFIEVLKTTHQSNYISHLLDNKPLLRTATKQCIAGRSFLKEAEEGLKHQFKTFDEWWLYIKYCDQQWNKNDLNH